MKLRKQRPLVQGSSNKNYRQNDIERPENKTQLQFLATAKPFNFSEIVKQKQERVAPDPLKETKELYNEQDRVLKQQAKISYERMGQLEEPELRKRVFNGESNTIYDPTHSKGKLKRKQTTQQNEGQNQKLAIEKHDQYTNQIQETQLVGIKNNVESLEGQVDLIKVKEIRRALRRRYANRKNFQKIYNVWDEDSLGKISVKNVYNMVQKLGIKANMNEARVLVASVDQDFSGYMSMDEFMDLIFNDSDNINVDLNKIPLFDAHKIQGGESEQQKVEDSLAGESKNTRELRHQNQLTMILKNKCIGLANLCRLADEFNSGFITQEKLVEILQKQNIPDMIMSKNDQEFLFNKYKFDDYKFNYKDFIQHLNNFEFKPDDLYKDPRDIQKEQSQEQRQINKFKEQEDQRIHVFNAEKVNPWHLEKIRDDYRKVRRVMFRYLETENDFNKLFMQQHKINNIEELKEMNINKKQLTQFIQNLFLHVGEQDVKKNEVQNFLSIFQYNKHDYTKVQDLSRVIYKETDAEWYEKFSRNLQQPLPPNDVKFHPDFPPDRIRSISQQNEGSPRNKDQKNNNLQVIQEDVNLQQPPLDNRRTQTAQAGMRRQKYQSTGKKNRQQYMVENNNQLQRILQKVEDRVFCGSQQSYKIFQQFDLDKDGYVSQKDFVNKIKQMSLLNDQEIKTLLNYVDPNNQGQLNFREFSDRIRDGVQNQDSQGFQTLVPGTQPSKEYLDSMRHIFPQVRQKHQELQKIYQPDEKLKPASRFQYTPSFKNTFEPHQPPSYTPQYQSASNRFNQTHNHRTDWQKAELHKKYGYEDARIRNKKQIYNNYEVYKQQKEDEFYNKESNKCKTKRILQWTYEHRAHLQNNWHGGGKNLVDEIKEEKEKNMVKPPLFGKWVKD